MKQNKKNKHLYGVIIAGGSGTRFWPLSRQDMPKQFLNILGPRSLFQEAILRIRPSISDSRIYVVTNIRHKRIVEKQIKSLGIPKGNVLLEPEGKNTAPAICWAAAKICKKDPDAIMAIFPADHLIQKPKVFLRHVAKAASLAQENYLVTLGIVPTRPETGYGYLKTKIMRRGGISIIKVERFVEKPNLKKAKMFYRQKQYLWNSGMFVWRCDVILGEFKRHLPKVHKLLSVPGSVKKNWHKLPNISVDYGILEKAKNVATVPADNIGWSDLGSWESLADVLSSDRQGNTLKGNVLNIGSRNTFVLSDQRLIAAVGLESMVIVDTKDALLVCRKDISQEVKDVVETLKRSKRKDYL